MAQIGTQLDRVESGYALPRPRARRWRALDDSRFFPTLLLMPILIFFIIWNVIPLLWLTGLSFYRYKVTSSRPELFVGFDNYLDILKSSDVWGVIGRTLTFMFFSVGLATVIGAVLGLLFWGSTGMPGRRLALTLLFTPMLLPPVAVGTFYRLIYDPTFGVINYYAEGLFGRTFDFLGNKNYAFAATAAPEAAPPRLASRGGAAV